MKEKAKYDKNAFEMLGGVEGARALADCFYDTMASMPEAQNIRAMHPNDLVPTCEKFALFLCGWLGGPPLYKEKYGPLDLTGLHALFKIGEAEKNMWLLCMEQALEKQMIDDELKNYLLERFRIPAEKIHNWCQQQKLQPVGPTSQLKG
ncbi:MAG: group II truncated hemoglobin [Desulfocapsaceae bacterium]|nr:group II truncated hemoglobin [Desulfocapsaceae bacterium]